MTENRETGDFNGVRTRKEVTLYPEKRGFRPLGTRSSKYPEKGDLVFPLIVLNHLPKRDLCPFKEEFQNTRKKVTFVVIEARKKNIRKSLRKNEDEKKRPPSLSFFFSYSKRAQLQSQPKF